MREKGLREEEREEKGVTACFGASRVSCPFIMVVVVVVVVVVVSGLIFSRGSTKRLSFVYSYV